MAHFEDQTCVFIVRIWLERRDVELTDVEWRGVIEHVPSGKRRYVRQLGDVMAFMTSYLESMGIRNSDNSAVKPWLKRMKRPGWKQN